MTTNRQMAGGRSRRAFVPRTWARPPGLALLGLAVFGLIQAGCRSDGCSDCNLGSKISNGVQALTAKVTKHFDGCHGGGGGDCGCGSENVVDSGYPITSGGMVMPMPSTIGSPSVIESPPTQLEAIPPPGQQTSGTTKSSPSGNKQSSYTTMVPKGATAQRRGTDVSRAIHSSPDGTASTDPFDNLPPVDLASEVTKNATPTTKPSPVASATPPIATPAASAPATTPAPMTTPTSAPTPDATTPTAAEKVSAVEGAIDLLPTIETPSQFQAPGIRRYASVAPSTSGGSAPSIEGLEYMKEKGFRTFIDLRKPSEIDPNFADAVNDRNMVYISLPIVANRLDVARLARFDDLVALADNRPLYFCDTDGTRAGLAWYIHLRVVNQEDPHSAASKAEEIGLSPVEIKLADAYLATNKPKVRAATARVALALKAVADEPKVEAIVLSPPTAPVVAPRSALPGGSVAPAAGSSSAAVPEPSTDPTPAMLPGEDRPQAATAPDGYRDPAFWRPVAALVLTGFGVPLAYWSRSAFSGSRTTRRARASLPGAVQSPSDVPAGSDA